MLKTFCVEKALNQSSMFELFKPFKDRRSDLQNYRRTSPNKDTITNAIEIVTGDLSE